MAEITQSVPQVGAPTFCHREEVQKGYEHLFQIFQIQDSALKESLFASILVENAVMLLTGTYGTGKTQLINMIRKIFFSDGLGGYLFDCETCHQELTAFDVLYHLDLAELQKGREVVYPKDMIEARLKFFNEIQRANIGFFNALLPLLSERRLTYRDHAFEVPSFVCFMDRNPMDSGSSEIPEAFMDRIDFGFEIPAVHLEEVLRLQDLRRRKEEFHWGSLDDLAESMLTFDQLAEVWQDVKRVEIPKRASLMAGMISDALRLCIATERSTARMEFDLNCRDCQFRGEICSHLLKVPGLRVTNSTQRLAQALAWLHGSNVVSIQDVLNAFPWCLSHRVCLRPEELRKQPSEQAWVREIALGEILRPKLPFWERALLALEKGDGKQLEELGENDLVIRELVLLAKDGVPG
jgi:MoxR-like ATPase